MQELASNDLFHGMISFFGHISEKCRELPSVFRRLQNGENGVSPIETKCFDWLRRPALPDHPLCAGRKQCRQWLHPDRPLQDGTPSPSKEAPNSAASSSALCKLQSGVASWENSSKGINSSAAPTWHSKLQLARLLSFVIQHLSKTSTSMG